MSQILISNGRVVDPANGVNTVQDVYIKNGKVAALGDKPKNFQADTEIDASGQIVCPGFIDLRVRMREPGFEHKGNIETESHAAARSGVTTICCPPDTNPVIDTPAVVEHIKERAEQVGLTRIVTLGALTQGLAGNQLSEMQALKQVGCVGLSNVGQIIDTQILRRAMEYAASVGLTVFLNSQDVALANGGCAHEGEVSTRLGLPGIPESAETVSVARDLQLVQLTGVKAHFCQLSAGRSVQMITEAQLDNLAVTADVAAYQLFLTDMDIGYFNSLCHVSPPLRSQRDQERLKDGLKQGIIGAICSNHQPHDIDAKLAPFPSSEPGISSIEVLLPLTLRLVEEKILSLPDAISTITQLPAEILGIDSGHLSKGAVADICIFDKDKFWTCTEEQMVSFGKNSPFIGWEFKGLVTHTLLGGKIVYQIGESG